MGPVLLQMDLSWISSLNYSCPSQWTAPRPNASSVSERIDHKQGQLTNTPASINVYLSEQSRIKSGAPPWPKFNASWPAGDCKLHLLNATEQKGLRPLTGDWHWKPNCTPEQRRNGLRVENGIAKPLSSSAGLKFEFGKHRQVDQRFDWFTKYWQLFALTWAT